MRDAEPVDYSGFGVPTLFIVGDQDELTLPWLIEATAMAVGGAEFATLSGAGHSAFYEQTGAYNRLVLEFFARVRQGEKVSGSVSCSCDNGSTLS
jgi:pimeloyl-ACP methyl ester carboxylesterase